MNPMWSRALILICVFAAVVVAAETIARWLATNRAEGHAINLRLKLIGRGRGREQTLNILRRASSSVPDWLPQPLDQLGRKIERMLMQAQVTTPTGTLMLGILI